MRREIVYHQRCLPFVVNHPDVKRFDERMAALEWALWLDAEDFPVVARYPWLRVARINGFGIEPTLRIFFEIENGTVTVHWIEAIAEA